MMMNLKRKTLLIATPFVLAITACTTIPEGPSMMVLPGTGKSFDLFQADDIACRQFAQGQLGKDPNQMAFESGAKSAALGTGLGAIAGAVINGGHGALIGAGTGMAIGGMAGAGSSTGTGYAAQKRYDNAYMQCMFAKGHRIPANGNFTETGPAARSGQTDEQQSYPPPDTKTPPPGKYIISD
ncbi:MAG: YMGG-like glycine zipper-containing protein [Betaproteobacteria bacterium]|nr:YMGG-like glycine zipper-containing protein [Betaproteobacteria bacterium]